MKKSMTGGGPGCQLGGSRYGRRARVPHAASPRVPAAAKGARRGNRGCYAANLLEPRAMSFRDCCGPVSFRHCRGQLGHAWKTSAEDTSADGPSFEPLHFFFLGHAVCFFFRPNLA